MKIKKLNESKLTNMILEDFIEDIMEYFYPDDVGSIGSYFSKIDKDGKSFFLEFQFHILSAEELKDILKVNTFCEKFDNNSEYYIYAEHIDDDLDAVCFHIHMDISKFDDINNDLQIRLKSKKYNL